MAFVLEDGTGLATANAYVSVADATTYHADRGNERWTDEVEDDQEAAIIRATDYIEQHFRFRGWPITTTQALQWPREAVLERHGLSYVDSDSVPSAVEKATAELALVALDEDLDPNSVDPIVESSSKKAGNLSISTSYKTGNSRKIFHKAKQLLKDLLAPDDLLRA